MVCKPAARNQRKFWAESGKHLAKIERKAERLLQLPGLPPKQLIY
jgi:hypothetical protein